MMTKLERQMETVRDAMNCSNTNAWTVNSILFCFLDLSLISFIVDTHPYWIMSKTVLKPPQVISGCFRMRKNCSSAVAHVPASLSLLLNSNYAVNVAEFRFVSCYRRWLYGSCWYEYFRHDMHQLEQSLWTMYLYHNLGDDNVIVPNEIWNFCSLGIFRCKLKIED